MKMEAVCSSETSVDSQRTTRRYIPEDGTLQNYRYKDATFHQLNLTQENNCAEKWNKQTELRVSEGNRQWLTNYTNIMSAAISVTFKRQAVTTPAISFKD
jgi:hypothetical protein